MTRLLLFVFTAIVSCVIHCNLYAQNRLTVEAAGHDITLSVRGPEQSIDSINPQNIPEINQGIILLTAGYVPVGKTSGKKTVSVELDKNMQVVGVSSGRTTNLNIPPDGFLLLAPGDSLSQRFLTENFRTGDIVKFRNDGEICSPEKIMMIGGKATLVTLTLTNKPLYTSLSEKEIVSGILLDPRQGTNVQLYLRTQENKQTIHLNSDGSFTVPVNLVTGVNYIDIEAYEKDRQIIDQSIIIYRKNNDTTTPEVVLWVEQFPNALTLTDEHAVEEMMIRSKEAGITAFGLDVKGPEGYVSYRKNDLSGSPYYTATTNPKKKVPESDFDLLESFVKLAHKHGFKIYASFNFFTEGNVTTDDYAVLNQHPGWEEIVQRPEDKGQILKISESVAGKEAREGKRIVLGFVNPVNREVQDFQLLRVREVLKNYDIDGVIMDRCRYDNLYADFSETTKQEFAGYLAHENKILTTFPQDAFVIDENGNRVNGKYFNEWITFRSSVIKKFTDRVRVLVNEFKQTKNPDMKLAAYVGSWYEVYWQNGVNWASPNFHYDSRLGFPDSELYKEPYYRTSYLGNIDFLMIGTYYKTAKEVNKYITLGNVLTNGELPLYGSMSLPDLKNEEQAEVFRASVTNSSGLMLFDLCYVNWPALIENMRKILIENSK